MDVFISYASADRDRVAVLVEALETEGFSVWWDQRIEGGTVWDEEIEKALESARSVLTIWTETSRTRRWVREEAHLADEMGKLIPLQFDPRSVPLGFRMIQAENFVGWAGDREANSWKRLVDQLRALGAGAETTTPPETTKPQHPGPGFGAMTPVLALFSLLAAGLLLVPTLFGKPLGELPGLVPFGASLATALFFLFLFVQAERWLRPQTKILISRWFLPVEGKARVNVAEAFLSMFEAVFGRRHLSRRCLWRSALASTLAVAIILTIIEVTSGFYYFSFDNVMEMSSGDIFSGLPEIVAAIPLVVIVNITGDYLSLWETRLVMRVLRSRPLLLVPLLFADFIFTTLIFLLLLFVSAFAYMRLGVIDQTPGEMVLFWLEFGMRHITSAEYSSDGFGLLFAAFLTTFITSVWLWLVLLLTPVSRLLVWAQARVTALGRLLDAPRHPVSALGAMIAVLIVLAGTAIAAGEAFFS